MSILHKNLGLPHRGHCAYVIKTNLWKLSKEVIVVYCKNDAEHTNTLCVGNSEF